MLKKFILFLMFTTLAYSHEADFITYDWLNELGSRTGYTDHIPHFRRLFNTMKVRGFLECGCGYSTKYFLDHCEKVISIEFLNPGVSDHWFNQCRKLYQDYHNWTPLAYNADHRDTSFNQACGYACSVHKDYALIDPRYLYSMDRYFKNQLKMARLEGSPIDVAFVDPGVYPRGDMVKLLLLNQVPVVVAHDTSCDIGEDADEGIYIWFVAKTPPDYEKIYIPWGQGATFWISHKLPHVIASMKAYRDQIVEVTARGPLSYEHITEIVDKGVSLSGSQ
jgi:hypothetical protein